MNRPRRALDPAPLITATPTVRTGAGDAAPITVTVTNRATEPREFLVSALGVEAAWVPAPSRSATVGPGESIAATIAIRPADGTLPARYPLSVVVQAVDPQTSEARSVAAVAAVELVVDAPGQITMTLEPADTRAIYSKRFSVLLRNAGINPESVHLDAHAPYSTAVDLDAGPHLVPPGAAVRVPGRLTVSRPTLFRRDVRHAYSVTARTSGAPKYTEGSLTARSVIGPTGAKVIAVLAVISVWVALAFIMVPKLADSVRKHGDQAAGGTKTVAVKPVGAGKSGGAGGSGGSGGGAAPDGSGSGGSGGGSGGGGAGGAGAAGAGKPKSVQLSGTVAGSSPSGVTVLLSPSTFGASNSTGGANTAVSSATTEPIGKIWGDAVSTQALDNSATSQRSVQTGQDGAWSFAGVKPVGYYQLQFSKPGYETQRFVVDPSSASASDPMQVTLVPGTGSMHGAVHDNAGHPVGAATITITDGTNTLTTSTVSKGAAAGTWSITGLSTPSSYLVTASHDGLGVASRLVTLAASGSSAADLTMFSDRATLSGNVYYFHGSRHEVGGATITATDGTTTRTTTSTTTANGMGDYVLPDLTVGKWVVTVQAAGYQVQTRQVVVRPGNRKLSNMQIGLSPSTVSVSGTVYKNKADAAHGLNSAGITLSNDTNMYKKATGPGGAFTFTDVAPGTYTLQAEYFGLVTKNVTVKAIVGKDTPQASVVLPEQHTISDSTIVGFVGNAVASSGSLCSADIAATCKVGFALTDSAQQPVDLVKASQSVTPDGPTQYLLKAVKDDRGQALQPGHYTLTISMAGYIPAKIGVNVPLNNTAAAPQVNLFPANALSGRIDTVGNLNGDGITTGNAVPTPGDNCVVAVPVGYPIAAFDAKQFVCTPKSGQVVPFGPDTVTTLQQACTSTGAPEPGYGVIQNDGTYTVKGLCDGAYNVSIRAGNDAYDEDSFVTTTQTVVHGQTSLFSPHLPRKPVITLHVSQLDLTNVKPGELPVPSTFAGKTVDADCTSTTVVDGVTRTVERTVTGTTDATGATDIYGISAGTVRCTVTYTDGVVSLDGDTGSFSALDDRQVDQPVTLVKKMPALFGQVVTTRGDIIDQPVAGATVHVSAITGYLGSTPQTADLTVTTNSNGCFVVAPDQTALDNAPGHCADNYATANDAFPASAGSGSRVNQQLISPVVTSGVDAGTGTDKASGQVVSLTDKTTSTIAVLPVRATPVSIPLAAISASAPGVKFDGVTVAVDKTHAKGAGTISASINREGNLIWYDSNIAEPNKAWQGSYTLTFNGPGFQKDEHGTMVCGVGADPQQSGVLACAYNPAFTVHALANLTGAVVGKTAPSDTTSSALSGASVYAVNCADTTDNPLPAALSDTCTLDTPAYAGTSRCPTLTSPTRVFFGSTDGSGNFDLSNGARRMTPGLYRLVVCAAGRKTYVSALHESDLQDVQGDDKLDNSVELKLLGGISGTVTGNENHAGLSGATVTLYRCTGTPQTVNGSPAVDATNVPMATCQDPNDDTVKFIQKLGQVTTDSSGYYQFLSTGTVGQYWLDDGTYQLSITAPSGFTNPAPVTLQLDDGSETDPKNATSVVLASLGGLSGTAVLADPTTGQATTTSVPNAVVTIQRCYTDKGAKKCDGSLTTTTNGSGQFQFAASGGAAFLPLGTYTVTVSATGFRPITDGTVDITGSGTTYPAVLTQYGALSGKITDTSSSPVSGADVELSSCTTDTTVTPAKTTCTTVTSTSTDGSGRYTIMSPDGSTKYFLTPNTTYRVTINATGFAKDTTGTDVLVRSGDKDYSKQLVRLGGIAGSVLAKDDGTPVNNAKLTLTKCSDTTAASCPAQASATDPVTTTNGGNYQFTGANGSPNFLDAGTYQLRISAPGFAPQTLDPVQVTSTILSTQVKLDRLGALSGTVVDNLGSDTPVANATLTAEECADSGCTALTTSTDPTRVLSVTTTSDGNGGYTFRYGGSANILESGTWRITATATGYQTTQTVTTINVNSNTLKVTINALASVSGTVTGSGAGATQQLSGATVTATTCTTAADGTTTCAGKAYTTHTDTNGRYTFAGNNTPWLLPLGTYQLSVWAFGYHVPSTKSVTLDSGPNSTQDGDFTMTVRKANQPFKVTMIGVDSNATPTRHAVVTLTNIDYPSITKSAPLDTSTTPAQYVASNIYPGNYRVSITGDNTSLGQSILPTNTTAIVPLVGTTTVGNDEADGYAANSQTLPVSVLSNTIQGTVALPTGAPDGSNVGLAVEVLVPYTGNDNCPGQNTGQVGGYCPALDNADRVLSTVTKGGGAYSIGGVPAGTYTVRINNSPSTANGYGAITVSQVSVSYFSTQTVPTQTLVPATHPVTVTLTYEKGLKAAVSGATGTLTNSGTLDGSATSTYWTKLQNATPTNIGDTSATFDFTGVQFGCWQFSLDFGTNAAQHSGTITGPSASTNCAANTFAVSTSSDSSSVSAAYTLNERQLKITPKITVNTGDTAPTMTIKVNGTSVGTASTNTDTIVYLPTPSAANTTVSITAASGTYSPRLWPDLPYSNTTVDLRTASVALTPSIAEVQTGTLTVSMPVTVTTGKNTTVTGTNGKPLTVSVTCEPTSTSSGDCAKAATPSDITDNGQSTTDVVVSGLAPGDWTVSVTGGGLGSNTYAQTVTVKSAGNVSTSNSSSAWTKQ